MLLRSCLRLVFTGMWCGLFLLWMVSGSWLLGLLLPLRSMRLVGVDLACGWFRRFCRWSSVGWISGAGGRGLLVFGGCPRRRGRSPGWQADPCGRFALPWGRAGAAGVMKGSFLTLSVLKGPFVTLRAGWAQCPEGHLRDVERPEGHLRGIGRCFRSVRSASPSSPSGAFHRASPKPDATCLPNARRAPPGR